MVDYEIQCQLQLQTQQYLKQGYHYHRKQPQHVNFSEARKYCVSGAKNIDSFAAHFGPTPKSVVNMFTDLKEAHHIVDQVYCMLQNSWQ